MDRPDLLSIVIDFYGPEFAYSQKNLLVQTKIVDESSMC